MQCTNLHCIYLSFFGFVRIRRDAGKPLVNNQNQSNCVSIPYIPPHRKRSRVDYVRGISPRRDVLMKRRRTANYAVAEWHLIKGRVRAAGQRIHPSSTVLFTHKLNLNADSCHSFIIVSPMLFLEEMPFFSPQQHSPWHYQLCLTVKSHLRS